MNLPRILATTIASLLTAATLHAQTWDGAGAAGGNLDWITATNWVGDVAPANNATANIIFAGLIDNNPGPNLDQNWNVNSVTFNNTAGAFTLGSTGGFTLTIGVGGVTNNDTQTQTISHSVTLGSAQTWNAASGGLSMISGTLNNAGNLLTVTGANDVLLSSAMTGAGGLTKSGAGVLTLSGAAGNTFSGPTLVNGGVLILQKSAGVNALTGSVTVGDGVGTDELRLGANNQIPSASLVTVANGGLFNLNGFSEGFLQLAVSGGSTTIGAGTLTLSTNLTMTGGSVSSTAGSLVLQGLLNTNAAATSATISGNLDLAAISRTFTIADGAAAIDLDVSAIISNGSIAKAGAGALRLSGANIFAGNFDLNAGTVLVGNNAAFGTSLVRLNGGSIEADGGIRTLANAITLGGNVSHTGATDIHTTGAVQITGTRTFTVADAAATFFVDGSLTESAGGFTFTKDGAGTLTLSTTGANTFAGTTVVNGGMLRLAGSTNTVRGNAIVGNDIGGPSSDVLRLDASNQVADSAIVEVRSSGNFFIGAFSDTIGGLTMKGGTVGGASGTLTIAGNVTGLADAASAQITPNVNLGGAVRTFTIADGAAASDLDVTSLVSNGGVIKDGAGTLRLGGNNTYATGTTLSAGTLAVGSDTALGTGTVTLSGGTLSTDGASRTLTNAISLNGTTTLIGAGGFLFNGPVTLAGASTLVVTNFTNSISGVLGGGAGLNKQGTGTLFLTGSSANTFTGALIVEEGLLALNKSSGNAVTGFLSLVQNFAGTPEVRLFANNQIADSVGVSVGSGALLNLSGFSDTIGALNVNGGSVATGAGTLTMGGNFSTGVTSVTGTVSGNLSLGGATRTFTVGDNAPAIDVDISAAISNGGIIKDGAGTLRLSGTVTNSFSGATTVNAGTLVLAKPAGLNAIVGDLIVGDGSGGANADVVSLAVNNQIYTLSAVTINSSGLLNFAGFNGTIGSLTMNGGSVTTGAGVLGFEAVPAVLSSTASASSATISGNVTLGGVARIFTVAEGAAVFDLDISATIDNGGLATGFTKDGAGLLRLSGTNTFTGGLTLNAGTLSIGSAGALNTSTLFINSGTVAADGAARTIGTLEVLGSGFVDGTQNLTVGGLFLLDPGTALAKNGTGTFTLPGSALLAGSLTLNAGTLAAGAQTLSAGGLFTQNGGTFNGTLTNQGTFTFNGGTFTGLLVNQGSVNFNANFTAANGINNTATITVSSGITVAANGPGLNNDGTLSLSGGALAGNGSLVNANFLSGFGTIGGTGGFTNNGLISVSGGNLVLANSGANLNAGNIDLPIIRQLRLDAPLTNTGTITLASTTINGAAFLTNSAGGIVAGRGTISAPLANSGGTLRAEGGTLTVTGNINNSGILRAEDGATLIIPTITNQAGGLITLIGSLSTSGALTNSAGGRIDFRNGTGQLTGGGALTNAGLITGDGTITKLLTNGGEVRGESGRTLRFSGGAAANAGTLALQGGTIEFTSALTNAAAGFVSGRGSLNATAITNNGVMAFSGGNADVHGDVTNAAGARIVTSGAGATTTFFDDVIHNGLEIFTGANASTVFFGSQSGAGSFTGTGTVYFIGDLRPGNSPASVLYEGDLVFGGASSLTLEIGGLLGGSQYDHLQIGGAFSADGDLVLALLDGFTPSFGDTFDLLDVGTFAGDFDTINAPALADGNAWDFSALKTTGSVTVVPEPGIGVLLASAIGLLGLRRSRPSK